MTEGRDLRSVKEDSRMFLSMLKSIQLETYTIHKVTSVIPDLFVWFLRDDQELTDLRVFD